MAADKLADAKATDAKATGADGSLPRGVERTASERMAADKLAVEKATDAKAPMRRQQLRGRLRGESSRRKGDYWEGRCPQCPAIAGKAGKKQRNRFTAEQ